MTGAAAPGPIPGEVLCGEGPVRLLVGREIARLRVLNTGDRPVQVGSHFHFAEANPSLRFDRRLAHGRRLAVPAGTAVRFEPGVEMDVDLVDFAGARVAAGFRGEVRGPLGPPPAGVEDALGAEGPGEAPGDAPAGAGESR